MRARSPLVRLRRSISVVALIGLLAFLFPGSAGAVVTGITGGNLTNDAVEQGNPDIWRGIVAWQDMRADPDGDIYGYDWNTETPFIICDEAHTQTFPAVGDEWVVWQDYRNVNSDIYAWNMVTDTEVPICTNGSPQAVPDIYQRYIVWHDIRNGTWDIYGYDLVEDTEFVVYQGAGPQQFPRIWGDVVVFQDSASGTPQIRMLDISTGVTKLVSATGREQRNPDICQEYIVWEETFTSSVGIRQYNISSEEVVTTYDAGGDQNSPRLDGDWLLFRDQASDSGDIGFLDVLNWTMSDVFPTVGTIRSPVMSHGTAVYEFNNGADDEIMIAEPTWTHDVEELAGDNRYETAGLIVDRTWRFGSADVVIATGGNFPDALGAGALAGQMNVPLVLTDGAHLSPEAADTLLDLGVDDEVIIIGGESAISDTVIFEIQDLLPSYDPIMRIAGDDRYQTAAAIADQVASLGGVREPYGFVCTGLNYPDALAASSMAYALGIPIYLVQGDSVPQALIDQMFDNGVTIPLIVGGTGAVSQAIEDQLLAEPGFEDVWRIWGSDRYATATELAGFAQHVFEFGASGVCVATGQSFPDALAGGQLAGNRYAPLLLTATAGLSPATHDWFVENADLETIRSVTFLGGPVAISPDVRADIDALLH